MKTDNAKGALQAKVTLRRNVLGIVSPARVFEAFCGLGEMWSAVWRDAETYLGCDSRPWSLDEQHRRLVCDNRLAMRAIDLQAFNVFDLDAYGSPWDQMTILRARRSWAKGETGAVVLTNGSDMKLRFGSMPGSFAKTLGVGAGKPAGADANLTLQRMALSRWLESQELEPLRRWEATGNGSGKGGQRMTYSAVVFRARG